MAAHFNAETANNSGGVKRVEKSDHAHGAITLQYIRGPNTKLLQISDYDFKSCPQNFNHIWHVALAMNE